MASGAAHDDVTLPELDVEAALSGRGFGFEITDLEPVIATLDQVLDDPLYLDYIGRINVDLGRWARPYAEDGWITIDGPIIDAATRIYDRTVELSWRSTSARASRWLLPLPGRRPRFSDHVRRFDARRAGRRAGRERGLGKACAMPPAGSGAVQV
jgi:hypothetical protein